MDTNALLEKVRQRREATGQNVRFIGEDGEQKFSFSTPERAEKFREKCRKRGWTVLS